MTPAAAIALAGVLAVAALAVGWLTAGGALIATAVGAVVLAGGGLDAGALLLLFFASGSVLTYTTRRAGAALVPRERRGRHAWQVVANAGWAALGAVLIARDGEGGWAVLTGALAAAQADTWATEIGRFTARPPRLITTGAAVPVGTSGAVSPLGTLGGAAGAVLLAGLAWALGVSGGTAMAALAGGVAGMTADSLLGATLQGVYHCEACGVETEEPQHACGGEAAHIRGWRPLDNHAVNLAATGVGAATATVLTLW